MTITDDKSHEWELLPDRLHAEGVTPTIKYLESGSHGVANNILLDVTTQSIISYIDNEI
jgi:hypothetical protein